MDGECEDDYKDDDFEMEEPSQKQLGDQVEEKADGQDGADVQQDAKSEQSQTVEQEDEHKHDEDMGDEGEQDDDDYADDENVDESAQEDQGKPVGQESEVPNNYRTSVVFTLDKELENEIGENQQTLEKPLISVFIPSRKSVKERSSKMENLHQKMENEVQSLIQASMAGAVHPPEIPLGKKHPGIKYSRKARDFNYYGKGERPTEVDAYFSKGEHLNTLPVEIRRKLRARGLTLGTQIKRRKPKAKRKTQIPGYFVDHRDSEIPSVPTSRQTSGGVIESSDNEMEKLPTVEGSVQDIIDATAECVIQRKNTKDTEEVNTQDDETSIKQKPKPPPQNLKTESTQDRPGRKLVQGNQKTSGGGRLAKTFAHAPGSKDSLPTKSSYILQAAYYGPPNKSAILTELDQQQSLLEAERKARRHAERLYSELLKKKTEKEEALNERIRALEQELVVEKEKAKMGENFKHRALRAVEAVEQQKSIAERERNRAVALEKELENTRATVKDLNHKLHSHRLASSRARSTMSMQRSPQPRQSTVGMYGPEKPQSRGTQEAADEADEKVPVKVQPATEGCSRESGNVMPKNPSMRRIATEPRGAAPQSEEKDSPRKERNSYGGNTPRHSSMSSLHKEESRKSIGRKSASMAYVYKEDSGKSLKREGSRVSVGRTESRGSARGSVGREGSHGSLGRKTSTSSLKHCEEVIEEQEVSPPPEGTLPQVNVVDSIQSIPTEGEQDGQERPDDNGPKAEVSIEYSDDFEE